MKIFFMGHEIHKKGIIRWNATRAEASKMLEKVKVKNVHPATKIIDLGVGVQQLVEIAKALSKMSNC